MIIIIIVFIIFLIIVVVDTCEFFTPALTGGLLLESE